MRYMLLIYTDDALWQREVGTQGQGKEMAGYGEYTAGLVQTGAMRSGDALQPVTTATTVRLRNGQRLVTDGPFAETKEVLAGYYAVEAKDLDEAIELAAKCPGAKTGAMEIRPIMEMPTEYQNMGNAPEPAGASA